MSIYDYIEKLNNECSKKKDNYTTVYKWSIADIYGIEENKHRNYCYELYTCYNLCSNCDFNLDKIKELGFYNDLPVSISHYNDLNEKIDILTEKINELNDKFNQIMEIIKNR